jgi:predicted ATPase
MRFNNLLIDNFRGIRNANLVDLPDTIVVAGPNGSGKSTIFDAIRLWKSAYAGYQADEIQHWLQEFGLVGGHNPLARLLQSQDRPMVIQASIALTDSEKAWIRANAAALVRESAYRRLVPNYNQAFPTGMPPMPVARRPSALSESFLVHEPAVQQQIAIECPLLLQEIENPTLTGQLICYPDGRAETTNNQALSKIFGVFDSKNIGIIDYHGAQRNFAREEVGGINLQIEQYEQQRQNNALYNYTAKYGGIKQELASAYVRDLIAKEAGYNQPSIGLGLAQTLDELFQTFFPGKKFKGIQPTADGSIKFDVETESGTHDINDLSSGEKELLYGYLRLRNYAPNNSIILIDEPELHLNPRLTDGLTDFYHRHVGKALGNQLWLVTHSDMILRQSVGQDGYKVYHMLTASNQLANPNQAIEVTAEDDVSQAVIDIVGDLASYKPGAKLVFIEGGGNRPFDETVLNDLFPAFVGATNIVTSGNKSKVRLIGDLFTKARALDASIGQAFSITDCDNDDAHVDLPSNSYRWDRYHIENYLLEPDYIAKVVIDLNMASTIDVRDVAIIAALKERAEETLGDLVRHELVQQSRSEITKVINLNTSRDEQFSANALAEAIRTSSAAFSNLLSERLAETALTQTEAQARGRFQQHLDDGTWIRTFRGRDILKKFAAKNLNGMVRYEVFRNLILSRMRDTGFQPEGIKSVLDKIMNAP